MRFTDQGIVFSPSDLTNYLDGEFGAWMDRWEAESKAERPVADGKGLPVGLRIAGVSACQRDGNDPEMDLISQAGMDHERAYLERLRLAGHDLVEIASKDPAAVAATLEAMRGGRSIIYQACLGADGMAGIADFLARVDGESKLGAHHYEVWDTKLAKTARASFLVQLCAYAEFLQAIQGRLPAQIAVVLGNGEETRFRTLDFIHCYRRVKRSFLKFHADFNPDEMPHPGDSRGHGRWSEFAKNLLVASDHLSQVATITRNQTQKLNEAEIMTMAALAAATANTVSGLAAPLFQRLRQQALLQRESIGLETPRYTVIAPESDGPPRGLQLLPPGSPLDAFFDMEGFPLTPGGLEYLFGVVHLVDGQPQFADWWAHDADEEKLAFQGFIDWVHARWRRDPSMHIYHYANYEVAAVRRLASKFATREREVDDLLRNEVFVDLYRVVRQGLIVGCPDYSLKSIERLFLPARKGEVKTAGGSVVAYNSWLESQQPRDWHESPILREIRDYNEQDCLSTWKLAEWLRAEQAQRRIAWHGRTVPSSDEQGEPDAVVKPSTVLAQQLESDFESVKAGDADRARVQQLLGWLLEFHWREAKPVFWRKYDRAEMSHDELVDDLDCLGNLVRTTRPATPVRRSLSYEYKFDPDQDTKLHAGSKCFFAHDLTVGTTIETLDAETGTVEITLGPNADKPPKLLSLIPNDYVKADVIADAVLRFVSAWSQGTVLSRAVDDLVWRRPPRIKGRSAGPLLSDGADLLESTIELVRNMDETVLCIQGPPGTGKTYTAAAAIVRLLKEGKRIGVTANGHKAILNLLRAVHELCRKSRQSPRILKVGGDGDDPLIASGAIAYEKDGKKVADQLDGSALLVGGTAWLFSRPELANAFDYLFIDEAGQFSLANTVGTGLSARNVVLVGDQMQLAQPVLGSHPGDSGKSALVYLLDGHATIPPHMGVFLDQTRRLHPGICDFISEAVYEGRLKAFPATAANRLSRGKAKHRHLDRDAGILFVPVEHDGNSQGSHEEVDVVEELVAELLQTKVYDAPGATARNLTLDDILFVAPFNMQVRRLKDRLGLQARVGSVDKFQGQEAHIVIVSMGSSTLEDSPRGATFLLEPNRINVAVTRAKTLAIIVGCPRLLDAKCGSIEEMQLLNLFCWLVEHSESGRLVATAD